MDVLITGGAGYIGSHTVWQFHDEGIVPVVVDDMSTGFGWTLPENVPLYVGDIRDKALLMNIMSRHSIDTVIHFAGSIIISESIADPLKYYSNNTLASHTLMETCIAAGVRNFVFSSTAAVYGIPDVNPVPETASLQPFTPYGASKLMTERMLADAAQAYDLRYTALRYFNVSGADPKGRTGQSTAGATNLIKVACEAARGIRKSLTVFGTDYDTPDGTGVRDYIHVSDLASAHKLAVDRLRDGGSNLVMNCGYGRGFSVMEVIEAVKSISGMDFDVIYGERRKGDAADVISQNKLILEELDWTPKHDNLRSIVKDALRWERRLAERRSNERHVQSI
ncbi:UDP-glucose 4-epimerase GalE [Roseibium sp. RKSG952]|uniref:UDP-glucose 4-epimerase GalE n=1 Tax=Roseibium sp. RKSG952 TaxID=2529384 RepID=UPI0012BD7503|nr:UDP-glucose 4-epimerase GalE [Roseibium sp. RKSG952]MTH96944.1 UDP-glucose 4-epimerase GalE [Roseibium sp. RKSG952]